MNECAITIQQLVSGVAKGVVFSVMLYGAFWMLIKWRK